MECGNGCDPCLVHTSLFDFLLASAVLGCHSSDLEDGSPVRLISLDVARGS